MYFIFFATYLNDSGIITLNVAIVGRSQVMPHSFFVQFIVQQQ
jgi:hypothetical protein